MTQQYNKDDSGPLDLSSQAVVSVEKIEEPPLSSADAKKKTEEIAEFLTPSGAEISIAMSGSNTKK